MEHLLTCWEQWKAKEPLSNKVLLELEVCIDMWHVLPESQIEQGDLMQEEEIHNAPGTAKDSWKHTIP